MSRMTARSCGSIQANARKARWCSGETHASSSGQRTSGKKKKAKPKPKKLAFYKSTTFSYFRIFKHIPHFQLNLKMIFWKVSAFLGFYSRLNLAAREMLLLYERIKNAIKIAPVQGKLYYQWKLVIRPFMQRKERTDSH